MPVNVGEVIETTARLEYPDGQDVVSVYQHRYDGPGVVTNTIAVDDIISIVEALYAIVDGFLSVTTLFRDIRIRNKTTGTLFGTFAWPTLVAGGNAGTELPNAVAALVSVTTAVPNVTLRKYLPRMTDNSLDPSGLWAVGTLAPLSVYAAQLITKQTVGGRDYRYGHDSPITAGFVLPQSAIVTNIPAYQRRRKPGRGS